MAKSNGIISLIGTIGGINFYMRNGKVVARMAGGGFTTQSIKKGKNMVRVRENGSEFGHCSRVKKVFKDCLFPFFGMQKDQDLHARMMQLFLKIKDCDITSERGKRHVSVGLRQTEGQKLLTGFAFTPFHLDVLQGVYDAATFTYTVSNFNHKQLLYPNGATHFEICLGVMVFDFGEMKATLFSSAVVLIAKGSAVESFNLSPTDEPVGNGMKIPILAYRYVQELNGKVYTLKDKETYGVRVLGVISS